MRRALLALALGCAEPEVASPDPEAPTPEAPPGTGLWVRPAALTDPVWCWTIKPVEGVPHLVAYGFPSGDRAAGPRVPATMAAGGWDDHAVVGDQMVFLAYNRLARLDLATSTVDREPSPLEESVLGGIAAWRGALVVVDRIDETLLVFDDWDALVEGRSNAFPWAEPGLFSRMDVDGDRVWGAWHATHTLVVADIATGENATEVALEGFDGWVLGLSVELGSIHVLTDGALIQFDLDGTRGVEIGIDTAGGRPEGLWCDSAP